MRRLLPLVLAMSLAASGVQAQPSRFNAQVRKVDFEPVPRDVKPEFAEDETSLKRQAVPIAVSIGLAGGTSAVPAAAVAAEVVGRLWGPRMSEALDEYIRQLAEEKPALLDPPLDDKTDVATARDLHRLLHERISRLPPAMIERYRRRVDGDAQQLLRDAELSRSPAPLRKLVRDYFNSGPTEKALTILGDAAFERGRFDEALAWWRYLAPLPSRRGSAALVYPAGTMDRDRVVAKEILALVFLDRFAEAEHELKLYEPTASAARGALAGEDDRYAVILRRWLARRRAASTLDEDPAWPTFAGATTGNRVLKKPPSDRLWIDGPTWRAPLAADKAPKEIRLSAGRAMSIPATPVHPIIVDGQLLFSDGATIESRDLATGALRFRRGIDGFEGKKDEHDETRGIALSAGSGVVCVRLGAAGRGRWLMGLDLARGGELLWKIEPFPGDHANFASDPVVLGDRVYVARSVVEERRIVLTLDCLDVFTGSVVWSTRLADWAAHDVSYRAPLLLADAQAIVVVSHAGFVMACDPYTGGRMWAIRYLSAEVAGSPRDVAAGLLADGRLYAAPADGAGIFAADLATGRVVWDRPWLQPPTDVIADPPTVSEVVQMVGVVEGRLLFTDRGRLNALDAATGATLWQQPALGRLPGQGRGLIAGSWVFWPTADPQVSWRAVTHDGGELRSAEASPEYFEPTTLRNLPAGNVVFGEGCLVIAGSRELVVFVPPERRLEKLKRDARRRTVQPETLGLLALSQRTVGQDAEAEATLTDLWSRVPFDEKADWQKLLDQRQRTVLAKTIRMKSPPPMSRNSADPGPATVSAPKPALGRLELAWGPMPGFAPPIEPPPGDWLIVLDAGKLVLVDSRTGAPRWHAPWKQPLLWLGRAGAVVVAAGTDSIEAFAVADGRPVWRRLAPASEPRRWAFVDGRPTEVHAGDRFVDFALGPEETLRGALGAGHREFTLSLRTGQSLDVARDHAALLDVKALDATPPTFAAQSRRSLTIRGATVRAAEMGTLEVRVDGDPERTLELDRPSSLTGMPADLLLGVDAFLALVPRNQGIELACYGGLPPRLRWTRPPEEILEGFDVHAAAIDERAVCYPQRGQVTARAMWSGAVLWQRPLPANPGPWQVDRCGDMLVVWPRSMAGVPFLAPTEMPLLTPVALAFGRRGIGSLPIVLIEPISGQVRQRIDVPHGGGPAIVWAQGSYLYATAGAQVSAYRTVGASR
jgi:outer membrane protein assembly factor BamB